MRLGLSNFVLALVVIALVLLFLQTAFPNPRSELSLFTDDFSSYSAGTFPGGWQLVYAGTGALFQGIIDTGAPNGKSLLLQGEYRYSSLAKKDFTTTSDVIGFEFSIKTDDLGVGVNNVAEAGFYNTLLNKDYPKIVFTGNRTIMIEGDQSTLGSYSPYTWYDLKVSINKLSKSYNVSIESPETILTVKNRILNNDQDPREIQSFSVASGWAGAKVYFDNARTFGVGANIPLLGWVTLFTLLPAAALLFLSDIVPGERLSDLLENLLAKLKSKRVMLLLLVAPLSFAAGMLLVFKYILLTTDLEAWLGFFGAWEAAVAAVGTILGYYYPKRNRSK